MIAVFSESAQNKIFAGSSLSYLSVDRIPRHLKFSEFLLGAITFNPGFSLILLLIKPLQAILVLLEYSVL
jgi:hypothetical protein